MSTNETRCETLHGMEIWITRCVLRGDIYAARRMAADYALLRDELPTSGERDATVSAFLELVSASSTSRTVTA